MSTVILIRPGRTDYDEQSRLLGTLEMPMNHRGLEDVQTIIQQLQQDAVRLKAIYSSPIDPASSTARLIAESLKGVKVKELDDLKNVDQGLWQGLPEAEVRKRYPKFFRNGREKPQTVCPPEGETLSEACQRIQKVLTKALRKYQVFGIVVPEPIATVIRCTLQQRCPDISVCLCGEENRRLVEYFDADKFDTARFVNSESCSTAEVYVSPGNSENTA